MVTLRVHLDAVDGENAPLLVLAGSHRLGRLPEQAIGKMDASRAVPCFADKGDVRAYGASIVQGSEIVRDGGRRRRVLQLDYAAGELPGGLGWAGLQS